MVEERRRARAACDLEGNRAGLGCLEHLGNALSFAVVTEWPRKSQPAARTEACQHTVWGRKVSERAHRLCPSLPSDPVTAL